MILILGFMVFVFKPISVISQPHTILDSVITFKARNITLYDGLSEIGSKIGYNFSYNADLIASKSEIKYIQDKLSVRNLLTQILDDTTLCFKVTDKQIIICKKNILSNLVSTSGSIDYKTFLQINGVIYNRESETKLAFANLSLLGKSMGTISNEQGEFNLKISYDNLKDTLVVSYIGFKNAYIPINQLSLYQNRIFLEEDQFQIQEIIIRTENAKLILKNALEKIKSNYYTDPYYITSFYREIVNNRKDLSSISEAVLEVYKSPYMGLFSDQIKLIKSRKNEFFSKNDTISLKLKGGLYASLYLDMIKNPSYFLTNEYLYLFDYQIADIVKFDNGSAYVISFKPLSYLEENSFEGNIYINTDNLAIVAIEFNITPEAIDKIGSSLVIKKNIRTKVKPVSAKYLINYRKINEKYFMNLARGELVFKVKYKKKLFSSEFKTAFEFATNNIDTIDVKRFDRFETISIKDVFIDENYQYDHQFWGEYNYISPDETLEEALARIQKKLDQMKNE